MINSIRIYNNHNRRLDLQPAIFASCHDHREVGGWHLPLLELKVTQIVERE